MKEYRLKKEVIPYVKQDLAAQIHILAVWEEMNITLEALEEIERKETPQSIIEHVEQYTGFKIMNKCRKREIVNARQIAIYLIKKIIKLPNKEIAKLFDVTHAALLHTYKTVENFKQVDSNYKQKYSDLFKSYRL